MFVSRTVLWGGGGPQCRQRRLIGASELTGVPRNTLMIPSLLFASTFANLITIQTAFKCF